MLPLSRSVRLSKPAKFISARSIVQKRFDSSVSYQHTQSSLATPQDTSHGFSPSQYGIHDKYSSAVIDQRLKRTILHQVSVEEAKTRIELAAAYRLFKRDGWNESIYNHLTAKVTEPDGSHAYLINPYGLGYDEMTASALIKCDLDGEIIEPGVVGDIFGVNKAGFVIHSAIHKAKPDAAHAVFHNHEATSTGIASTQKGFIPALSQTSEIVGPARYHDFQGIVVDVHEQASLVKDLGDSPVLIFRNHGLLTVGDTIGGAWYRMYLLVRAMQIQAVAQAAASEGNELVLPDPKITEKSFEIGAHFSGMDLGKMEFAAEMRWLDKNSPSYRT